MARAAAARNSWMERMLQKQTEQKLGEEGTSEANECKMDKEAKPKISVQLEVSEPAGSEDDPGMESPSKTSPAAGIHWLLKTAIPEWTFRELQGAKEKLTQVGIFNYAEFEEALREKGALNQRLRDHSLKVFGNPTLARLRKIIDSERDRKRCEQLLAERRRRERIDEERHRLDQENRATMEPSVAPSAVMEEAAVERNLGSSVVAQAIEGLRKPTVESENMVRQEATGDESQSSSASQPKEFRSGLSHSLLCGQSWEWPLTRQDRRERITMLDRELLESCQEELEDLKARIARKKSHSSDEQSETQSSEEEPDNSPSCIGSEWNSELGVSIAG